jgi:Trypsin-like peptidase domain
MKKSTSYITGIAAVLVVFSTFMPATLLAQAKPAVKSEPISDAIARLEQRIHQLEQVKDMPARVSHEAGGSVGLIVGEYIWTDLTGRKPLRYEENNGGNRQNQDRHEAVTFDGDGPIVVREFQGTGFLIDPAHLLTSMFLLDPWESDPLLDTSENPQLVPSIRTLHVYLPGVPKPIDIKIDRPSESNNAVICALQEAVPNHPVLISNEEPALGEPILLLGYLGGVEMLTSRVPDAIRRELYAYGQPGLDEAAQFLAAGGYISPIAMQSTISAQTEKRVFFETYAADGSTGGPIFNAQGQVVAINQAMYPTHPSWNMASVIGPLQSWIADVSSR